MGDKEEEVDVGKGELSDYNVGLTPVKGEWEEKDWLERVPVCSTVQRKFEPIRKVREILCTTRMGQH